MNYHTKEEALYASAHLFAAREKLVVSITELKKVSLPIVQDLILDLETQKRILDSKIITLWKAASQDNTDLRTIIRRAFLRVRNKNPQYWGH